MPNTPNNAIWLPQRGTGSLIAFKSFVIENVPGKGLAASCWVQVRGESKPRARLYAYGRSVKLAMIALGAKCDAWLAEPAAVFPWGDFDDEVPPHD